MNIQDVIDNLEKAKTEAIRTSTVHFNVVNDTYVASYLRSNINYAITDLQLILDRRSAE